jgi:hypothetical protein
MDRFDDFGSKLGKCLDLLAIDALVVIVLPMELAKLFTLLRVKVREQNFARVVLFDSIRWSSEYDSRLHLPWSRSRRFLRR